MEPEKQEKPQYMFCYTNIVNHNLIDTLVELKNEGYPISPENCLNLCGICRRQPICRMNSTVAYGTPEQIAQRIREHIGGPN